VTGMWCRGRCKGLGTMSLSFPSYYDLGESILFFLIVIIKLFLDSVNTAVVIGSGIGRHR
jgi:hypothetical protein